LISQSATPKGTIKKLKASNLKGILAQANTIISSTEMRLKKAMDKLQIKRGKMLLTQKT